MTSVMTDQPRPRSVRKILRSLVAALAVLTLSAVAHTSEANEGRVTFLNDAQKDGEITVTIHYKRDDGSTDSCTVTLIAITKGTRKEDKCVLLKTGILDQCPGSDVVALTAFSGTTMITSQEGRAITEIDVVDTTNQRKQINPKSLDDDKLSARIILDGTWTHGTALLAMEDCASTSTTTIDGKTGLQVAQSLVAGIVNCGTGSTLQAIDLGSGAAEIRFSNLRSEHALITFDGGGEFGISETTIVTAPFAEPVRLARRVPLMGSWAIFALCGALAVLAAVGLRLH